MDWIKSSFDFLVERPFLWMALVAAPMLLLAMSWRIFPSRKMVVAATIPLFASGLVIFWPGWLQGILILDAVFVLTVLLDVFTVPAQSTFSAVRTTGKTVSQGKPHDVDLEIANSGRRAFEIEVHDDLPEEFITTGGRARLVLKAHSRSRMHYRFRAMRRGLFQLHCAHIRAGSLFRMWHRFMKIDAPGTIHVYPDMKQLGEYELLARTNRLSLLGLRRSRRAGTENEFERLRDYTIDDDYRRVDWRASARRQHLIVRDYQANQNQQVIFMIDCGRLMTGQSGKLGVLDHALNSMLMLAWIALSRGDSVGLVLFSNRVLGFVPPRTGTRHVNQLLHASFDQFAQYTESRYDRAFLYLDQKVRKRSLVILITNVIDQINATIIKDYLVIQAGKHLPLGVFLRDHDLYRRAASLPERSAMHGVREETVGHTIQIAANEIVTWREQAIAGLAQKGVLTIDAWPDELTAPMVNKYLEIKARGLL